MRVALINRDPSCHPGGDLVMLRELQTALMELGVDANVIAGEWRASLLKHYDVVHLQHINFTWSADNVRKIRESGVPFVVVPIFYPTDILGQSFDQMRETMLAAAAVCPLSHAEAVEIMHLTGFSSEFTIIPHGTSYRFHFPDDGPDREFVMVANARGGKNEGVVEDVCAELRLPYRYVHGLSHEQLPDFYRRAKVFVHTSSDDRMSLTVGEALCAGCRVISSVHDRGNEWFEPIVTADPRDREAVRQAVAEAWDGEWNFKPNLIARSMSWKRTARMFLSLYEKVANA